MAVGSPSTDTACRGDDEHIIPLHSETLDVSIKSIVTGEVEISTVTRLHDVDIDEPLISQHASIERVAIGRIVETAPDVREEDGVLIIPVVEEMVVVEKRLFLKEEVHIRRTTATHRHQETVTLRAQEAVVTRTKNPDAIHQDGVPITPEEIMP